LLKDKDNISLYVALLNQKKSLGCGHDDTVTVTLFST
jgi:hypothetical protein